jgi:P-type Cu+ transporter
LQQGKATVEPCASGAELPAMAMATQDASHITTSLLLSNLHCPSCVSSIKEAIHQACGDQVIWVSPNVVTSVVTIEHKNSKLASATVHEMAKSLEDIGFEICGVTSAAAATDTEDLDRVAQVDPGESSRVIAQSDGALDRWMRFSRSRRPTSASHSKHQAHLQTCRQCRASQKPEYNGPVSSSENDASTSNIPKDDSHDMKDHVTSMSDLKSVTEVETVVQAWRATIAVGGMTCAACSNTITEELMKQPYIYNAVVNLVTNSAAVDFIEEDSVRKIVESIEDLGYEATLDTVVPLREGKRETGVTEIWRASLSIGGMTCAACSNTITDELKKLPYVSNIIVNLVTNSATIDLRDGNKARDVVSAIEDLGYDATLNEIATLREDRPRASERTVEILIDGLFCEHCPDRIVTTLGSFGPKLEVLTQPTIQRPILKIRYTPHAPSFTIRHILLAVEAADPSFTTSIYHPPTLEERSKMIQSKHQKQLLLRVGLTAFISVPTFVIGIVYMSLLPENNHGKHFLMMPWTSGLSRAQIALFILATPVYFFAADIFHTRAVKEVRNLWKRSSRTPILQRFYKFGSMNMLMSLGTTIAYVSSVSQMIAAAVNDPEDVEDTHFYFDSVVFLTLFLLLGRLIESYSKSKTGDAVELLGKLRPTTAILVEQAGSDKEKDITVNVDQLEFGDIVRVPHGSSPAADGTILQGETSFDESSLTGESRLVAKSPGDEAFAGTVNKENAVLVRITGVAGSSMLDQIVSIVREGQTKRAPMERIADLLTAYFVPFITLFAIITWVVWMLLGFSGNIPGHYLDTSSGWVAFALQFAIAVFVVACPCGLALAAPTAIFVGGGLAAKHGILAKGGGEAFEKASKVDCVVFDKTGTLTVGGEPKITDWELHLHAEGIDDNQASSLLGALKAMEANSTHPIAKAIVNFCASRTGDSVEIQNLRELPGKGMKGQYVDTVSGKTSTIIVGNEGLMQDHNVLISEHVLYLLQSWKSEAKSVALVATSTSESDGDESDWTLAAALSISDPIRTEAIAIIKALKQRGTRVWMLSGDNAVTANAVAQRVGIDASNVLAEVLPSQKAEKISYLQSVLKAGNGTGSESTTKRAMVAMVGDGINDSPALAKADVGIAIGSGSDIAISSADFVLVTSDLRAVLTLLELSRTVFRRIKLNFGWAVIYNLIAVPVAAGALYPVVSNGIHVRLDPVWASLAMALSSISVVLSSLALRTRLPGIGFRSTIIPVTDSKA